MLRLQRILQSSRAALDLASIMVGIIVIGLIGGVIAATIFAVIPWAQDNAARQQLSSIHTAENALYGLSAAPDAEMKGGVGSSTFTNSAGLDANGLLIQNPKKYCVVATGDGQDYNAYSRSDSGKIFTASNYKKTPVITTSAPCLTDAGNGVGGDGSDGSGGTGGTNPGDGTGNTGTGTNPGDGTGTGTNPSDGSGSGNTGPAPVVSDLMKFTINCPAGITKVGLPLYQPRGTITWNDGRVENYGADGRVIDTPGGTSYYNLDYATVRTVTPGTTYTAVLQGTVKEMRNNLNSDAYKGSACITSVDEWGTKLGLTSIALNNATNLTSVPTSIPPSVTSLGNAFQGATNFKQDLSTWNTVNIINMSSLFMDTSNNSDLSKWNTSNAQFMTNMFANNAAFNQPIGNWDTSNVSGMLGMFHGASSFNQDISKWNTAKVTDMSFMFADASAFNQPIGSWNVGKATTTATMFSGASSFNQPLNNWVTTANGSMAGMFYNATKFNQPLNNWDVSNVLTTESMFTGASSFNQDITNWRTGNVLKMSFMFKDASSFSQNLSTWNVSRVQYQGHQNFELGSALTPDQYPKFAR